MKAVVGVRVRQKPGVAAALLAMAMGLNGCTGDETVADPGFAPVGFLDGTPTLEELPGCREVSVILGDLVTGLIPVKDDEGQDGRYDNDGTYGVSCTWLSADTATSQSAFDLIKTGSFTVGISVSQVLMEEQPLREMRMVGDDPRVDAIGGFLVNMGADFPPDEPLGIVGQQVVVGSVNILAAAGGAFLQKAEGLQTITNDRAIEASVNLHKAIR